MTQESVTTNFSFGGETVAMTGELFFKSGLISIDQLCHALYVAHKNSLPLGRVLVMLGMTKTRILEGALTLQNLVRQNVLSSDQAVQCLNILGNNKVRVEEVLEGLLNPTRPNNTRRLLRWKPFMLVSTFQLATTFITL